MNCICGHGLFVGKTNTIFSCEIGDNGQIIITSMTSQPLDYVKCRKCGRTQVLINGMVHPNCPGCEQCQQWLPKATIVEMCRDCGCQQRESCLSCPIWPSRMHHKLERIDYASSLRQLLSSPPA